MQPNYSLWVRYNPLIDKHITLFQFPTQYWTSFRRNHAMAEHAKIYGTWDYDDLDKRVEESKFESVPNG